MISKDEQDTDIITEEELLEIDAVDEHELYKAELEKEELNKLDNIEVDKPALGKKGLEQATKKPTEHPLLPKEVDLLVNESAATPPITPSRPKADATPVQETIRTDSASIEPPKPGISEEGSEGNSGGNDSRPTTKKRNIWVPLVGLTVIGGLALAWYQTTVQLNSVEKSLAEVNQQAMLDVKKQEGTLALMQQKIGDMSAQQQELQSTLSRMTDHKEDNWLLAEALYLSRLAVERLQTTQDVKTAIMQLTAADDRLKQVADPSLMPVRKILVDKIAELKAVNAPDFEGLWLQLGTVSEMADKLVPLNAEKNKKENKTYPVGWKGALSQSWAELKTLVKVRSPEENASAPMFAGKMLSELNDEGLKRGFRLFIEQSRWALVQREGWLYLGSIDNAQKWLKTYFNQEATAQLIYTQLEQLKGNHIEITVPDVSPTVTAIHDLIQQRQKMLAS